MVGNRKQQAAINSRNAGGPSDQPRTRPFLSGIFLSNGTLPRSTVLSSLVISILGLALPLVMLQIYDRILINQSHGTLFYLMAGLFSAILLECALRIMRAYLIGWSATRSSYGNTLTALTRIVRSPSLVFERDPATTWMDRLDSLEKYNSFATGQSRLILLDVPFVAVYLAFIYIIAAPLMYVLVVTIGIFMAVIALRASALRKATADISGHNQRRDDFISETLEGIETVKLLAMEPQIMRRFERLQITNASASLRGLTLNNELQVFAQLAGNVVLVTVVTFGAYLGIEGTISVGTLAAATLLTSRVMQPVMRGIQVLMEMEGAKQAYRNSRAIFELPARPGTDIIVSSESAGPQDPGTIHIEGMSFAYHENQRPTLGDINLSVQAGEIIGINGGQSSGKSTLLRIMLGEMAPTQGKCLIGGRESHIASENRPDSWIVRVSQDSAIFKGSIIENIAMFRDEPDSILEARKSARRIGLEDDIHRLPQGYDTPLGTGISEALSRGMIQRIAIARAIALHPRILLFDEANTMLDLRSDDALKTGLAGLKGRMTILLVSNRPSLLAIADRRYSLTHGRLAPLESPANLPEMKTA